MGLVDYLKEGQRKQAEEIKKELEDPTINEKRRASLLGILKTIEKTDTFMERKEEERKRTKEQTEKYREQFREQWKEFRKFLRGGKEEEEEKEEHRKIVRKLALDNRKLVEEEVRKGKLVYVPGISPKDRNFKYCVKKALSNAWGGIWSGVVLFVGGILISAIPLLCIIGLPVLCIGFGLVIYSIVIVPFATYLHESNQALLARYKEIIEEERKKEAEEKGVEYLTLEEEIRVKNKMLKEDAQKRKEEMEALLEEQTQRKREEQQGSGKREKIDTFTNMKVDMGDGKKMKFTELPKHLQEQLLKEYSEEVKEE